MRYPNPKNIIAAAERRLRDGTGQCWDSDGEGCVYYHRDTGNRCVVGALLTIKQAKKLERAGVGSWFPSDSGSIPSILGPDHWSIDHAPLLRELQNLHDDDSSWDHTQLSPYGENKLAEIKEAYL